MELYNLPKIRFLSREIKDKDSGEIQRYARSLYLVQMGELLPHEYTDEKRVKKVT